MISCTKTDRRTKSRTAKALLCSCAVASIALGIAPAHAENEVAPASEQATEPAEIFVTAQRRVERSRDVPLALSKVSSDMLQDLTSSGQDIKSLSARVPSLFAESTFNRAFPRFYIRGLGNNDYNYNAAAPVSVVYDDVVMENPAIRGLPAFDTASVEVLKGPQGTLFGRNTPAGVVKIDSVTPQLNSEAFVTADYSRFNSVNVVAAVNTPLIPDKLLLRVSGLYQRRDNWVKNSYPGAIAPAMEGYSDLALRLQLKYIASETVDATLNVHGRSLDGSAAVVRANTITAGTNKLVDGFSLRSVNFNGGNELTQDGRGGNLKINVDLGGVTLASISSFEHAKAYSRADIDGGAVPNVPFDVDVATRVPSTKEISQELRATLNGHDRLTAQAGLYYFYQTLSVENFYYDDNANYATIEQNLFSQKTTNLGAYGSLTYRVADRLKLAGGLRFSHERRSARAFEAEVNLIDASRSTRASNVSGDFSATFAATPNVNVYARVATGYQAPSLARNFTDADISVAKAQTTRSVELGIKGAVLDHRLNFSLTAYDWRTKNLQVTATTGSDNTIQLTNAKLAVGRGVEAEADFRITPRLSIGGSMSYNYTQIRDPGLEVAPCGSPCTLQNPVDPQTGLVQVNGNPLYNAPSWILNASVAYTIPIQADAIRVNADWSYRSSFLVPYYKAKELIMPALPQAGGRITYINTRSRFEISVFARNLFNTVRAINNYDLNTFAAIVNEPRIIGIGGSLHL